MSPLSLILLLVSGIGILFLPRKYALIITISAITLIPMNALMIGPASFYPIRIIIFFGLLRLIIKGERISGNLNKTDKLVILLSIVLIVTRLLKPRLDTSIIARFAETYEVMGIYFLYRAWIKDLQDIYVVIKTAAVIFIVLGILMVFERFAKFNIFSVLGGVPPDPAIREGRLRCQGPFQHSILAGTVPATSAAWFIGMYLHNEKFKIYGLLGFLASIIVVLLTSSSGPIMSLFFVIVGFSVWPLRYNMKNLRFVILFTLIILQLVMKSPVWYLISKIDLTGSSTGWHRSELIDTAIRHFSEWWFLGTDYTRHWMPTGVIWTDRHTDITDHYIKYAVDGGLAAMVLFIWTIVSGFSMVGKAFINTQSSKIKYENAILIWALGCTLFSHAVTFLSVRYFDQSFSYYFLALAMISCVYYSTTINNEELQILT